MSRYRIVLADDHALVREGIKRIIQEDDKLSVIDETGDGGELLRLIEEMPPDMILLDISMPGLRGLEAIKIIKQLHPTIKILILTMHKTKEFLYLAINNGADGYVLKEDADEVLRTAIKTVRRGQTFISPAILN